MSWVPVNDAQADDWQLTLPASIVVDSADTLGGAALGSLAIGGYLTFTYRPNQRVWVPVQDANIPGWTPVTA